MIARTQHNSKEEAGPLSSPMILIEVTDADVETGLSQTRLEG